MSTNIAPRPSRFNQYVKAFLAIGTLLLSPWAAMAAAFSAPNPTWVLFAVVAAACLGLGIFAIFHLGCKDRNFPYDLVPPLLTTTVLCFVLDLATISRALDGGFLR